MRKVDDEAMESIMEESKNLAQVQVSCCKDQADNDINFKDDHANLGDGSESKSESAKSNSESDASRNFQQ